MRVTPGIRLAGIVLLLVALVAGSLCWTLARKSLHPSRSQDDSHPANVARESAAEDGAPVADADIVSREPIPVHVSGAEDARPTVTPASGDPLTGKPPAYRRLMERRAALGMKSDGIEGRKLTPRTKEERARFIQEVLDPMDSFIGEVCFSDLRVKYEKKLKKELTGADLAAAQHAVNDVIAAEFEYRTIVHERIKDYVKSAPDLADPVIPPKVKGRSGTISKGVGPEDGGFWGPERATVIIRYFLAYDDHPKFDAAHDTLLAARRKLDRYNEPRKPPEPVTKNR
jgi:hypothetical protein